VLPQQPFLVPSIILAFIVVPLALGVVPPNRFYGARTKKTLADRELWRRANVLGGGGFGAASVVYIFAGRYVPSPPPGSGDLAAFALQLALFLGPLLLALLLTGWYVRRL